MGLIQRLPPDVVNRMAAGEVLARPCNAIKELIENSLDAGATEIMVNVQNAGLKLLQVTDNGKGIEREDFDLVCERFATSKLHKFEDLMHMKTYGFRGEALASLSHVAKVNIVSKRAEDKCAYQGNFLDGKLIAPTKPSAGKTGTCITATDLFYNLPTRRNKMATHGEETKAIHDILVRFAIHRPDVSFALRQNQSSDFRTKGDGSFRDVVCNLLGRDLADTVVPLSLESTRLKFKFTGNISKPIASATAKLAQNRKSSRSFFSVFINGRSVRCDILKQPIDDVLQNRSLFCQFCSLHLEIDETRIDVNVHPTKSSVIFLEKEDIIDEIRNYFENFVSEIFGFEPREAVKSEEDEEENNTNSFSFSQIPIINIHTQSIKSIEGIRKSSSNSELKPNSSFRNNEKKRVDYMDIRTDSKERKIDEFVVRCPNAGLKRPRNDGEDEEIGDLEPVEEEDDVQKTAELDDVSMVSLVSNTDGRANDSQDLGEDADLECGTTHREFDFESLDIIRRQIVSTTSLSLREMIKTSTFVGSIDCEQVLFQFGTSLYIMNFKAVLREFFYQISIFSFGNFGSYRLEQEPPSILEMLELIGELSENDERYKGFGVFKQEEKRVEAENLLGEQAELLHDYFAIKMEWFGEEEDQRRLHLTEIPSLVHYYVPQLEKLPFLIAALILDVDYDDEQKCFESVSRAIGDLFTLHKHFVTDEKKVSRFSTMYWKPLIKQILMPLVKRKFIPPEHFKEKQIIKQLADSHDLYKVFERCGA
ncbi:CBN-MLH-1 protein [Caenorhabditis brenneri]|uniref:CBN-MLH-1 protein n=1 Tax=Caenorhabditis brenneri TaxID=135651 RepID=G0NGR7_CAEBE|nr:CBN-MLH-1 protein [Caenorhabditis brenneri]